MNGGEKFQVAKENFNWVCDDEEVKLMWSQVTTIDERKMRELTCNNRGCSMAAKL